MGGSRLVRWVGAAVAGFVVGSALGQAPSLTLIGVPSGALESRLTGVSADGRVAIGYSSSPSERGLSWTALGGLDPWGYRADVPTFTRALGVSGDGSSVVGQRFGFGNRQSEGFRYDGTYHALLNPAGYDGGSANGISGNGQTIAGAVSRVDGTLRSEAVLWNAAGVPERIGAARASDVYASFNSISRDGSTAIGVSAPDFNGDEAYSWTRSGGWQHLPAPASAGADYEARPNAVNYSGSLVVGSVDPLGPLRSIPVLWQNGVPTELGTFGPQFTHSANGVSDDGRIIAGGTTDTSINLTRATIWLDGGSPVFLQDYLESLGVFAPPGWTLQVAGRISADGRTLIGNAVGPTGSQGFVATIPSPSGAAVVLVGLAFLNGPRRRH